jgi:hypothetical protein
MGYAMHVGTALAVGVVMQAMPAAALADPGPPSPCINAVYNSMQGVWGVDDAKFDPNRIPASAWTIVRDHGHANIMALLTNGETNFWFLTEYGADFTHDLRTGSYEGVYNATQLISCRAIGADQPGVLESMISVGPDHTPMRQRIEVTNDHLTIQRFDHNNALVSEDRMRRFNPSPDPMPAPPRR